MYCMIPLNMQFLEKANLWEWKNRLGLGNGIKDWLVRYEGMFLGGENILKLYYSGGCTILILMKSVYVQSNKEISW